MPPNPCRRQRNRRGRACARWFSRVDVEEFERRLLSPVAPGRSVHRVGLDVPGEDDVWPDPAIGADLDVVDHRRVDAEKAIFTDLDRTGDNDVRRDEAVISD